MRPLEEVPPTLNHTSPNCFIKLIKTGSVRSMFASNDAVSILIDTKDESKEWSGCDEMNERDAWGSWAVARWRRKRERKKSGLFMDLNNNIINNQGVEKGCSGIKREEDKMNYTVCGKKPINKSYQNEISAFPYPPSLSSFRIIKKFFVRQNNESAKERHIMW